MSIERAWQGARVACRIRQWQEGSLAIPEGAQPSGGRIRTVDSPFSPIFHRPPILLCFIPSSPWLGT